MMQFQWNQLDPECHLDPSGGVVDDRAIFRLHWGVELEEVNHTHVQEMMKHVEDLRSKVRYGYETTTASAVFIFSSLLPHPSFSEIHSYVVLSAQFFVVAKF